MKTELRLLSSPVMLMQASAWSAGNRATTIWIPTVPDTRGSAAARLYAPLQPYLDATWPLPDIQRVK